MSYWQVLLEALSNFVKIVGTEEIESAMVC